MDNRFVITTLCVAAIGFACGPWLHSQSSAAFAAGTADLARSSAPVTAPTFAAAPLARASKHGGRGARRDPGTVAVALMAARSGTDVRFALRVVNATPGTIELKFPTARTHDVIVLDAHGHPVWRSSAGRLFTQTMQAMAVGSRDTLTLDDTWDARGAHGTYTAVALLDTESTPVERRVDFTLP